VLASAQVTAAKRTHLQALHAQFNPFQLRREVEQQMKGIEACRLLQA
jgi:hypothetical protein